MVCGFVANVEIKLIMTLSFAESAEKSFMQVQNSV